MAKIDPSNHFTRTTVFENEIFDDYFKEIDREIKDDMTFHGCTFKMPLIFDNIKSKGKLYFFECTFEAYSIIENCELDIINFLGCQFNGDTLRLKSNKSGFLHISNFTGKELYINGKHNNIIIDRNTLSKCILKDINTEYSQAVKEIKIFNNQIEEFKIDSFSLYSNIKFQKGTYETIALSGTFNNSILFEGKITVNTLYTESSNFKERIDINEGHYEYIHFRRSTFEGLIWVNGYDVLKERDRDLEIHDFSIHSNNFEQNINLNLSNLENLGLSNNNFKKLLSLKSKIPNIADHSNCIHLRIDGTNQGNVIIQNANLDLNIGGVNLGNLYFKNITAPTIYISDFQNNGNVSFSNIISGDYFTIQESAVGKLDFLNTDFEIFNEIVISDSNLGKVDFSNFPFKIKSYSSNPKVGYGLEDKSLSKLNLKNVYNQLKKSAKSKGDVDIASKYQSLEFRYLFFDKTFGFDKVLLFLNWISNDFGRRWFRGVLFTFLVGFGCFTLYMKVLNQEFLFPETLKNYAIFISSFPKLELSKFSEIPKTWDISLIVWMSRIFVSYGIYQTVAAFRKYGKL